MDETLQGALAWNSNFCRRSLCNLLLALTASMCQAEELFLDLTDLSLEELMNIEVTLVSRKPEKLSETTAAIFVITPEDLRRSGVRSIPEALRLVPGVQVGRVDANKWVVTSRGFPGLFSNKLLVLIDGRSVYTPLFSGVFWEAQDVVLEDVERIEVIRGPGSALWGANAVNGIINIITRKARDTQGEFVQVGGGSEERGFGTVRYGGRLHDQAYFRAYGKYFTRDDSKSVSGRAPLDAWHINRAGGRVDWTLSARDALSVLGNAYTGTVGQTLFVTTALSPPYAHHVHSNARINGGDVLGRWERRSGKGSDLALQFYYDRSARKEHILEGVIHNIDIDFQQRLSLNRNHEMVWGLGYHFTADKFDGTFTMSLHPESRNVQLFSGFAHDDITLAPKRLRLTLGSKVEHNSYTGLEIQPNVRVWWSPALQHVFWGAVSRAVRTPSRADNDIRAIARAVELDSLVALVALVGNRDFESEELLALDLGYRTSFNNRLALDLALFYNLYDDLRTNELGVPFREETPPPAHQIIPLRVENKAEGQTYGIEVVADWQEWNPWRLRAIYSYLQMVLEVDENSFDLETEAYANENPDHQLKVVSHLDLPGRLELDVTARYMDELSNLNIDHYLTFDIHLGWNPCKRLEMSLVGRNLLDSPHPEFVSRASGTLPTRVEAGVYGALNWKF